MTQPSPPLRLGLGANAGQFGLLVGVNALVGGMIGQERTVLPLLATKVFHLSAYTAALTFVVAFGLTKAVTNFLAGVAPIASGASRCWWRAGWSGCRCRCCSSGPRRGDGPWPPTSCSGSIRG